ncbi:MAG: hypothetical protein I4O48_15630 [Ralstonia sp.]|nr:hypothetical protein [Ralstonia sp.]
MKNIYRVLLLLLACTALPSQAQFTSGQVLTAAQLNSALDAKTSNAAAAITGGTITGLSAPIPLSSGGTNATTATGATSQLQYLQGATGSVARSLTSKFQDWISALDFSGVDPTGTTDSTAGLQSAITAAANKNLYIPPGNYKVTSLTLSSPIAIIGGGPGSVTFTETSATGDMFTCSAQQVLLQGMAFTSSVTRTAGAFVNFTSSSSQVTLRDFYMSGHYIGVHMTAASAGRVQFGYMYGGATTAGATGILIDGGNDQYLNQITMDAPAGSQPPSGIQVTNTGALNFTDLDIIHHTDDLLINPGNGQTVASLWAENSYFDTAVNGIHFKPTGTGNIIRARFVGTWTSSHSNAGILAEAPGTGAFDGVEFIGHHAFSNTSNGVVLNGGTNFRFLGGAYAGNTAGSAFSIAAGVSGWSIEGAKVGSGFGFGGNTFGVYIAPGSSNNWALINNDLRGNSSAAMSDGSTGTAKIIKGNLGYNPIASTSITVGASPFTYTNNTGDTINVFVTGGTVSSVTLGGNAVATATNTVIPVPQGASVVVTYSAAPTMTYIGN